ncbi:unnamed protein product, partial [Oppiella nova]
MTSIKMGDQWRRYSIALMLILLSMTFDKCVANDDIEGETTGTVDKDLGAGREGSRTDDEVVVREEEAIKLEGLSVSQLKQMRESAEKFAFQAEVNKM